MSDFPSSSTIHRWLLREESEFAEFRAAYGAAMRAKAENLVDLAHTIGETDADARTRIDLIKWHASKLYPRKYGDLSRHEVSGPGGEAIKVDDARERLKGKLAALLGDDGA